MRPQPRATKHTAQRTLLLAAAGAAAGLIALALADDPAQARNTHPNTSITGSEPENDQRRPVTDLLTGAVKTIAVTVSGLTLTVDTITKPIPVAGDVIDTVTDITDHVIAPTPPATAPKPPAAADPQPDAPTPPTEPAPSTPPIEDTPTNPPGHVSAPEPAATHHLTTRRNVIQHTRRHTSTAARPTDHHTAPAGWRVLPASPCQPGGETTPTSNSYSSCATIPNPAVPNTAATARINPTHTIPPGRPQPPPAPSG